jgi:hypothetical protein
MMTMQKLAFGLAAATRLALAGALAFDFVFGAAFNFAAILAAGFRLLPAMRFANAAPSSAGERTVVTRAASSAANLSAAVPLPPEMTAPAWPMRLPGGAVTPAM